MEDINKIEETSVTYTICNYCIHKNKSLKTIMKLLSILEIDKFSTEDISTFILNMGYNWNMTDKQWEKNVFHADCNSNKEISVELPGNHIKLDFTLSDLDKEISVSPNDALTLLKNMSTIQYTLNKILNLMKKNLI